MIFNQLDNSDTAHQLHKTLSQHHWMQDCNAVTPLIATATYLNSAQCNDFEFWLGRAEMSKQLAV